MTLGIGDLPYGVLKINILFANKKPAIANDRFNFSLLFLSLS